MAMRVAMMLVTALGAGMIAHAAWMNVARGMASEGDGGVVRDTENQTHGVVNGHVHEDYCEELKC